MEEFEKRLLTAMDQKGFKAVDLCERLGIPKATMSYYMNGAQKPRTDRLHQMAILLDVSEAWLIGFDVPMDRDQQRDSDDLEAIIRRIETDMEFRNVVIKIGKLTQKQLDFVSQLADNLQQD